MDKSKLVSKWESQVEDIVHACRGGNDLALRRQIIATELEIAYQRGHRDSLKESMGSKRRILETEINIGEKVA